MNTIVKNELKSEASNWVNQDLPENEQVEGQVASAVNSNDFWRHSRDDKALYDVSRVPVRGGAVNLRHSRVEKDRPFVLFLHGLGDSGDCFEAAFSNEWLTGFNLLVPDLLGFGESDRADDGDYSFGEQAERLVELLDWLGVDSVYLVGHSSGGDLGTVFCEKFSDWVDGFCNVEGTLTEDDLLYSSLVVAAKESGSFDDWFDNEFSGRVVGELEKKLPVVGKSYRHSLAKCDRHAFLETACETHRLGQKLPEVSESDVGRRYARLEVPKEFLWGTESLSQRSVNFLEEAELNYRRFEGSSHWPMLEQPEKFYVFLGDQLTEGLEE